MFDQSKKRIGFCCKYLEEDQTQPKKVLLLKKAQLLHGATGKRINL